MAKPRKIILAEDNAADVELTKLAFQEVMLPLDIVHVYDGQELLNLLRSEALESIALVMIDLNMPKVGGIDVLKVLYEDAELKKLPVIVFSSSTHETDVLTCYEYGANAYVNKPVDVMEFNEAIRAIANFWGDINVLPTYSAD